MDTKKNYIWYASYGSNLSRERFMCYIEGGKPKNSKKTEKACRDTTPPKDDKSHKINHALYFAGLSAKWNNGGSCILSTKKSDTQYTLGRKYLITKEQFLDIVGNKNEDGVLEIDFDDVIKNGSKSVTDASSGNILYLGHEDGYPIFTFTAHSDRTDYARPDTLYLETIGKGIIETYNISVQELADYYLKLDGIKNNYTKKELINLKI